MFGEIIAAGIGAAAGIFGQERANDANREMAERQMQFQERMSSTAYQRATADMKAAGINPMVAYSKGGASSPGGASATMQNTMEGVERAATSAVQMRRQRAEMENLAETNKLIQDQAAKTKAETIKTGVDTKVSASTYAVNSELFEKIRAEKENVMQGTELLKANTASAKEALATREFEAAMAENLKEMEDTPYAGQFLRWLNHISKSVQGAADAGSSAKGALSRKK